MKLLAILAVCVVGLVSADNFGQYVAKSFFKLDENGNPSPIRPIMANTLNRVRRQIQPFQPFGFAPLPIPNFQPGQGQGNFVSTSQVLSSRFGDDEPHVSGQTTVIHTNKDGKYQQTTTNLRPDGSTYTSHNTGRVKRQQTQLQSQGGPNGNQQQSQSQNQPGGGQQIQSQTQGSDPTPIAGGSQHHAPAQGHSENRIPEAQHPQQSGQPQQGSPQQAHPQQGHPQQGSPQQGHPQQGTPQQGHPQQGQNPSGHDQNTESRNPQDPGYQQGQGQYPQQGQGQYPQQGYQGQQGGYQGQPGGYQGQQGGYPQQPFGGSPFGLGAFGPGGFPQFGQPGFGAGPGFGGPGFGQPGFGFGAPFGGFQQPGFGGGFPVGGVPVGGPGSTFTANRVGLDSRFNDDDDRPSVSGGTTSFTSNNGVFHSTSQVVGPDGKVTTHKQSGRL